MSFICPPHLHNAAALSWEKLIYSFQRCERCFLRFYMRGSEMSRFLQRVRIACDAKRMSVCLSVRHVPELCPDE